MSEREFLNRINESWALVRSRDNANVQLAIFVHGFWGSYLSTWGKLPDMIKQHAESDPVFRAWDFLFLGYDTQNIHTYLDIAGLVSTQWKNAQSGNRPYNRSYTKLALFGHSLGTLGIRQLLCAWSQQPAGMQQALHSVTLFGTPLNGSRLAWLPATFPFGPKIAEALRPNNPQLRMLKVWADSAHSLHPWPQIRVVLGQDDQVVGDKFAELITWTGDASPPIRSKLDHADLVKPDSWSNSEVVDHIANALR